MATITEDFVSFDTARLLKEKNFPDFGYSCIYDSEGNKAQTQSIVMKWLRKKHNKFIEICTDRAHNFKDIVFRPAIYDKELDCLWESDNFSSYEQAAEAAIKYCLEKLI